MFSSLSNEMKDNHEFNQQIISLVKKNKVLYDTKCEDYSNKNTQEIVWRNIATELGETVVDIKDRWRNIRTCYTRYLRRKAMNPESKTGRRYYLAKYLSFLLPFTKSRKDLPEYAEPYSTTEESDYLVMYNEESSNEDSKLQLVRDPLTGVLSEETSEPPDKKFKIVENNEFVENESEVLQPLDSTLQFESDKLEESDLHFFKSLVPDLREMNTEQKRRFKIGVLNLVGDVLKD